MLERRPNGPGPLAIVEDNPGVRQALMELGWWWSVIRSLLDGGSLVKTAYGSNDILAAPVEPPDLANIVRRLNLETGRLLIAPETVYV